VTRLWITIREAAELTGFSDTTIRRGIAAGSIPVLRSHGDRGAIRVARSWVEGGSGQAAQGVGDGVTVRDSLRPARRARPKAGRDSGPRDLHPLDGGGTPEAQGEARTGTIRYTFLDPAERRDGR
jgi:excisionase family DNA binding protein